VPTRTDVPQTKSPTTSSKTKKANKEQKSSSTKKTTSVDLEKSTTFLLEEYLGSADIKEAEQCVKELKSPKDHYKVVELGIMITLDRSDSQRELMSKLFSSLSKEVLLSEDQFAKGLKPIVESIEDLELDNPFSAKFIAKFIASAIEDNITSLQFLNLQSWFSKSSKKFLPFLSSESKDYLC